MIPIPWNKCALSLNVKVLDTSRKNVPTSFEIKIWDTLLHFQTKNLKMRVMKKRIIV